MIDHEIVCDFTDLEREVEETSILGFAAKDDLEYEVERHAMVLGAKYNTMPRQRSTTRWEIREPGELVVVIRAAKIIEEEA